MQRKSWRTVPLVGLTVTLLIGSPTVGAQTATPAPAASTPGVRLPPGVSFVTSVEGISEYRLPNGLKVLLFPDASKPTMTVNITYLVGSQHENYGETGMAHLLEHLVFKGTPRHPNIPQEFKERGANFNGTTFFERTNYYVTLPATSENLRWALDLEADRMVNSFIAKKDLETEFSVVRNEFEAGENNPVAVLGKQVRSAAFDWHNYGNSTIGNRSDVENVPIERLQAFYKKYYQPDNAVLLIAGNFSSQVALDTIAQTFGKIPKPQRKLDVFYTQEPTQDGERSVTVRRVGDQRIFQAAYHVPGVLHADFPAIDVMADILAAEPAGRLHKALVEAGKAAEVAGGAAYQRQPDLLSFYAFLGKDDNPDEAREILLRTIESFAQQPPTTEEVERVKAQNERVFDQILARPEQLGTLLSEFIALGDWRTFYHYRDAIQKVTPADVQRVARTYLKPTNRTLGQFIPTDKPDRVTIPVAPSAQEVLKDFKGRAALAAGETLDPDALKLEARIQRGALPSGIEIATLPYDTRGDKVELTVILKFGDELSLRGRTEEAPFVGAMLQRGSQGLTRQELQDRLARLKSGLSVSSDATGATVRISSDRQNLPEVLTLMDTVLRRPAWSASEFEQLKKEAVTGLEASLTEPQAIAGNALSRHFMVPGAKPGDVRYVPTLQEQVQNLKSVTLDEVRAFYNDFWGAGTAFVGVVGDFDPQIVKAQLEKSLGNWKPRIGYKRIPAVFTQPEAVNREVTVPDKANAVFVAGQSIRMRDDHPDYPAMVVANFILGGGGLSSRLADRLRQKEGLSYGAGSGFTASQRDEDAFFQAYAIYNPDNAQKLEQAFREELQRALRDGFTDAEVTTAKQGLLQARRVARTNDASLAGALALQQDLDRTFRFTADVDQKVAALTPAQVNAALRKYVDPAKMSVFKVGSFGK